MRHSLRRAALALLFAVPVGFSAGCNTPSGEPPPVAASADSGSPRPTAASPAQPPSGSGSAATEAAAPNEVVIDNFAYVPAKLVVKAGTKVTWVNRDDVPHTATSSK